MHRTLSLLVSFLGVLSLASGRAVAQATEPTELASTFVEHDSGLVRLTLLQNGPFTLALAASAADEVASAAVASPLFTAGAAAPCINGGLSAVRNADGTWSAAGAFNGGASTYLYVWPPVSG